MRYPCPKTGKKDVYPRCTAIISEATDKSYVFKQWASDLTVEWVKENAKFLYSVFKDPAGEEIVEHYQVTNEQLNDARFHHVAELKRLGDIGTDVHRMIKNYIKKSRKYRPRPKTKEAETAFGAFFDFVKNNDIQFNATEQCVYGSRWAGTLDIDWFLNGIPTITDVKTSDNLYPETRYQTAAYRDARTEQLIEQGAGYVPEANSALRLDRSTGEYEYKPYGKTYNDDLEIFNAMVNLYYLRHPRIAKKFREATECT